MDLIKSVSLYGLFALLFASCNAQSSKTQISTKKNLSTMEKITKSEQEWRKELSPERYYILREKGTERPYTGELLLNKDKGIYRCAGCGNELFTDEMKFDSHCGWPGFDKEIAGGKIETHLDKSHGMMRTEITCAKCGGHLGHLFNDGPTATGQRYCVNSLSLEFVPATSFSDKNLETITLGGGCFWCVEAIFQNLKGVEKVESGYAGGITKNPTYEEVCSGTTGHAEVIQITYDPKQVSLNEILEVFFSTHDPTTLNRQGADQGTQYRSAIFYSNENQRKISENIIKELETKKIFPNKIVTTVVPLTNYSKAESYHQNYYNQNKQQGYCQMVITPKIEKFKKIFKEKLKE